MKPRYTVLRDTGEKEGKGWIFDPSDSCAGTVSRNLFTGDYSLEGFYERKLFVIERKGRVTEFVKNLSVKEKWDDFKDELERLESFRHPWLVLEFPLSQFLRYPEGSGLTRDQCDLIRVSGTFLIKRFHEIEHKFRVKTVFAAGDGHPIACSLFKRIFELYGPQASE